MPAITAHFFRSEFLTFNPLWISFSNSAVLLVFVGFFLEVDYYSCAHRISWRHKCYQIRKVNFHFRFVRAVCYMTVKLNFSMYFLVYRSSTLLFTWLTWYGRSFGLALRPPIILGPKMSASASWSMSLCPIKTKRYFWVYILKVQGN
jgi:hypothetical protein